MTLKNKIDTFKTIEFLVNLNYDVKHDRKYDSGLYGKKNKIVNSLIIKAAQCEIKYKDPDFYLYITLDDEGKFRYKPCPVLNFVLDGYGFRFHHPEDFRSDVFRYIQKVAYYKNYKPKACDHRTNFENVLILRQKYNITDSIIDPTKK